VIADDKLFLQEALKQGHHDAKSIAEDCMVTLTNTSKQNAPVREFVVSRKTIACMVSYIGFENAPLDQMLNVLSLVQSLFYPTDDERHDESLAYYRQREWRIVDGFVSKGSPLTRPLVDAEKKRLIEIDQQFWNGTICYSNNKKRRVDIDRAVNGLEKRPMTDLISKVWVPKTAHDTAARLFGDKVAVI
jgi:hypothetical protein